MYFFPVKFACRLRSGLVCILFVFCRYEIVRIRRYELFFQALFFRLRFEAGTEVEFYGKKMLETPFFSRKIQLPLSGEEAREEGPRVLQA